MFMETITAGEAIGLEEATRPATRPVRPSRPTTRACHVWLASPSGLRPVGSEAPDPAWHAEINRIAAILGPHFQIGDESSLEISQAYSVACVATRWGWLIAVGTRGQEARELRSDVMAMRRIVERGLGAALPAPEGRRITFADVESGLRRRVALSANEVELAQRLWGRTGPLTIDAHGRFVLMAHADRNDEIEDFARRWETWTYRFRLATGRRMPSAEELVEIH